MTSDLLSKSFKYISSVLGLNKEDVLLASYPRSGNTWIRFFFCNLISLKEWDGKRVDFEVLNNTMPEFGKNNLMKAWTHETAPRVVKTHKNCWPIFKNKRSILIVRDPRDVMVSYYHYKKDKKGELSNVNFPCFLRNPKYGLRAWFEHYESWQESSDLLVKYEDMKRDDVSEFTRMIEFLNLPIEKSFIKEAAKRASFRNVRSIEEKNDKKEYTPGQDKSKFTRDGSTKQWKDYFKSEDLELFKELKRKFRLDIY